MIKPLQGMIAPQLTPFKVDETPDYEEYARLSRYLVDNGIDGIFVCGTTGEFVNLTIEERERLLVAAKKGSGERVPLLFNVTAQNLQAIKELCKFAQEEQADAISITPPYYHYYDDMALFDYFRRCIEFCGDLPVYLYNIPGMVKNKISASLLKKLSEACPAIKGIKDSSMDFMTFLEYQNVMKGIDFQVITGNDAQVLTALSAGGSTAVIALAGVYPSLAKSILIEYKQGDATQARQAQDLIMELRSLVRSIMPVMAHKEILSYEGFQMGPARFPFRNLTYEEKAKIKTKVEQLGLRTRSIE